MTLVYIEKALKQLKKLDKSVSIRILSYMDEVAKLKDPRERGKSLVGNLTGFWRYRIGDYRILDEKLVIFVVEIGHRREVYK